MSKRSRERRKRMEAERIAREARVNTDPVTGDMESRAATIVHIEDQGGQVGHVPVTIKPDSRLPAHYGGNGRLPTYGFMGIKPKDDCGYKPIDHDKDRGIFRVETTDIVKGECPIAKIPKVYVSNRLWGEWVSLAADYDTEWLAYLTGQFVNDDNGPRYEVRKMYFPPQVAHASHVEVDDDFTEYLPNTIGAIHSHVGMVVFFSGEDMAHSNWPVEIVVNNKAEVKVMIRHQLECGKWIKNYSELLTVGDQADSRLVQALDIAFKSGEKLHAARVKAKQINVGYRTPEVSGYVPSKYVTTYDKDAEWHFKINGKPMKWDSNKNCYVEVVKVNGEWVEKDDPDLGSSQIITDQLSSNDLTDEEKNIIDGEVIIDEATGQILLQGERSQAEIDTGIEAEVDSAMCEDCKGTGKVIAVGVEIECTGCGGRGLKPEYYNDIGGC